MSSHKECKLQQYTLEQKRSLATELLNMKVRMTGRTFARSKKVNEDTFKSWVRKYAKNCINTQLTAARKDDGKRMRERKCTYELVEQKVVDYIHKRNAKYQVDKCGSSWALMQDRTWPFAREVLSEEEQAEFKASYGWLSKVLLRNGLTGVTLHGEASDINVADANVQMTEFWNRLERIFKQNDFYNSGTGQFDYSRVYNADETGLFYQQLPNLFLRHLHIHLLLNWLISNRVMFQLQQQEVMSIGTSLAPSIPYCS